MVFILGVSTCQKQLTDRYEEASDSIKSMLNMSRKATVCLDGWSKKGLSASYLGISACVFHPVLLKPLHVTLNLHQLHHPHTGDVLASCLEKTMTQWGIPADKVMLVITDNGANLKKAIRLLQNKYAVKEDDSEEMSTVESAVDDGVVEDGSDSDDNLSDGDEVDEAPTLHSVPYRRMSCLAHTVQLLIKPVYVHFEPILSKTRHLVARIRKSSVAVEQLVQRCGKTVVTDCSTRWNSTYLMVNRLLQIKTDINFVLLSVG